MWVLIFPIESSLGSFLPPQPVSPRCTSQKTRPNFFCHVVFYFHFTSHVTHTHITHTFCDHHIHHHTPVSKPWDLLVLLLVLITKKYLDIESRTHCACGIEIHEQISWTNLNPGWRFNQACARKLKDKMASEDNSLEEIYKDLIRSWMRWSRAKVYDKFMVVCGLIVLFIVIGLVMYK